MENSRWNKIRGSRAVQAIGALLLCISLAGIILSAVSYYLIDYFGISKETTSDYTETAAFTERLEQLAHDIEGRYDSGRIRNAEIQYSVGESNVQFALRKYNPQRQTFELVSSNTAGKQYNTKQEFTFGVLQQGHPGYSRYYYTGDLSRMPEDSYQGYRVTLYIQDGLPVQDEFQQEKRIYDRMVSVPGLVSKTGILCGSSVLVFLVVLIFEFCAAGHKNGTKGIALSFLDRIPMDLLTLICMILIGSLFALMEEIGGGSGLRRYLETAAGGLMIAEAVWLVIFLWMMSFAARVKAGTLFSNNIWYQIIRLLVKIIRETPFMTILGVLAMIFWLVGIPIFVGRHYLSRNEFLASLAGGLLFSGLLLNYVYSDAVITKAASALAAGNLNYRISDASLKFLFGNARKQAEALNSIGEGMAIAIEKQLRSERLKTELITNVSHDIKTPLTSIISYTDLLQKEHTEEQEKEYLAALARQSARLKKLTEDIVEASKASSGVITAEMTAVNVRELLDQAVGEYEEKFHQAGIEPICSVKEDISVTADGKLLWRVISNLLSNVQKYAMPGSRVYLAAEKNAPGTVCISIKNISRDPLNISEEELMERFVRGDESRHTEGSGLGLNIARSLVSLMNGSFDVRIDGDLFRADIVLSEAV